MNQQDLDKLIDAVSQEMVSGEPSRSFTYDVMGRGSAAASSLRRDDLCGPLGLCERRRYLRRCRGCDGESTSAPVPAAATISAPAVRRNARVEQVAPQPSGRNHCVAGTIAATAVRSLPHLSRRPTRYVGVPASLANRTLGHRTNRGVDARHAAAGEPRP